MRPYFGVVGAVMMRALWRCLIVPTRCYSPATPLCTIACVKLEALDTARALQAGEARYTYAADGRKLHVDYVLNPFAIADEGEAPNPEGPEGLTEMAGSLTGGDGLQSFDGDPIEIEEPDEPLEPQVLMTRDWCGGHLYRNGALERIENEYGYWADSCYHYRIADYQGNVRAVISQNGVLERSSTSRLSEPSPVRGDR